MAEDMTAEQLRAYISLSAEAWKHEAAAAESDDDTARWQICMRASGQLSEIAARLSGMAAGWQPIETAPFDGTKVLALGPVGPDVMYWNVEDEYWVDPYVVLNGSEPCRPSFWMPIPPEPPHV